MPSVTVSWLNDGKPLQVRATIRDLKVYEDAERAALKEGSISSILEARVAFLERVIKNANQEISIDASAGVDDIQGLFSQAWRNVTRAADSDPLG